MKSLPPVVDEDGNINLHGRQGAVITLPFVNDDGSPRNVSAVSMMWECGPSINIALTNGSSSDKKTLTITNANVKTIQSGNNREFVLLDNSAAQPTPLWMGTVFIHGWVE